MKFLRIAVAIVLTLGLLYIARATSRGHSEIVRHTENGYAFRMETVPKFAEQSRARIEVLVYGQLDWETQPILRYARAGADDLADLSKYHEYPLIWADSSNGRYFAELSTGPRGSKIQYFVEVIGPDDKPLATLMDADGKPFVLKSIGHVPAPVLIGHIGLMFATVFSVALGSLEALAVVTRKRTPVTMARYFGCGTLFAFVGGLPFGIAMNWFAFATTWEGAPFGSDVTDNKTQILLVYLLFVTFAALGSLTKGRVGRDAYSPRALGAFGALGFIIMLLIYLVPHSVQYGPALTYSVCYSFIALWAVVYLLGLWRSRRAAAVAEPAEVAEAVRR